MLVSSEAVVMPLSSAQLYAGCFDAYPASEVGRSRLIPPDLLPLTRQYPEALSSLIIRAAEKLLISPSQLVEHFILPGTEIQLRGRFLMYGRETYAINGVGLYASAFLQRLNQLLPDSRRALYGNHTFLTPLFGPAGRNVTTTTLKWCSSCLREGHQLQAIYYPLYWFTYSAQVCIRHHCFLHTHCGCCRKKPNVIAALSKTGYCNHCQTPLWETQISERQTEPGVEDFWKAEMINQLILSRHSLHADVIVETWKENLEEIVSAYPSIKAAEQALELSDTLLKRWRGRNRPCLPQLIDLAFKLGTPLHDLLSKPVAHARRPSAPSPGSTDRTRSRRQLNKNNVLLDKAMTYIAEANSAASIKGLCWSLGISEGAFRHHWPFIAQELGKLSQEYRQSA